MNYVEPIRNPKKISQIKNLLRGQARWRDLLLFTFGINTALRASDLLTLEVAHVLSTAGDRRDRFALLEQKTGKRHDVAINESMTLVLDDFLAAYPDITANPGNALFFDLRPHISYRTPIGRAQASRIIATLCEEVGLSGHYGMHTLRKTWGYQARMNGIDLALIMRKLNHSDFQETMRYLGITDDELQAAVLRLNL